MKLNILRTILIALLIALFAVIFNFSSQDGEKSGSLSREVTIEITKNIKSIQKLEKSKKEILLDKIEHVVRKMAHFTLYTQVGILMMSLMTTYNISQKKRIGISLSVGVLYAISDEIHQFFVPDRGAMIQDVLIDSLGATFGISITILVIKGYKAIKKNYVN